MDDPDKSDQGSHLVGESMAAFFSGKELVLEMALFPSFTTSFLRSRSDWTPMLGKIPGRLFSTTAWLELEGGSHRMHHKNPSNHGAQKRKALGDGWHTIQFPELSSQTHGHHTRHTSNTRQSNGNQCAGAVRDSGVKWRFFETSHQSENKKCQLGSKRVETCG